MQITKRKSYARGEGYGAFITINEGSEQCLGYFDTSLEADNALDEEARKHLTKPESVNNEPDMFTMDVPEDDTDVLAAVNLLKLHSPNEEIQAFLTESERPQRQTLYKGGSDRTYHTYRDATQAEADTLIADLQRGGQSELQADESGCRMLVMERSAGRFRAKLIITYYTTGYDAGKLKFSVFAEESYQF